MKALKSVVVLSMVLALAGSAQAATILGTGAGSLLGSDLTDVDNSHNEGAYNLHTGGSNNGGFDAEFYSSSKPGFGGENSFQLFDNAVGGGGAKWCCDGPVQWVAARFDGGYELTHFTMTSGNDSPGRRPDVFAIQGSNNSTDGSDGTWTDIYAYNNNDGSAPGNRHTDNSASPFTAHNQVVLFESPLGPNTPATGDFAVPDTAYTWLRYKVDSTAGWTGTGGEHQLNEVEYFGTLESVVHEVGGDGTIGTETLNGAQSGETYSSGLTGAKFVRVDQNRGDDLNIAEVQAFETGTGANVALASVGSTATQSSTDWGGVASRAIDGNTNGAWSGGSVQHTGSPNPDWWQVELASAANLDSVHIWGRTDGCCDQRLDDFNLVVEDAAHNELYNQRHTGVGTGPGSNRLIPLQTLLSADLTASLQPHDFGAGWTYVFELGSADMIEVDNPDPGVFTTYLELNDADIVVELGAATPTAGDIYDLLGADVILGTYNSLTLPDLSASGLILDDSNFLTDGTLEVVAVVPEPLTMLAVGLSLTGLGRYVRRRRRA